MLHRDYAGRKLHAKLKWPYLEVIAVQQAGAFDTLAVDPRSLGAVQVAQMYAVRFRDENAVQRVDAFYIEADVATLAAADKCGGKVERSACPGLAAVLQDKV